MNDYDFSVSLYLKVGRCMRFVRRKFPWSEYPTTFCLVWHQRFAKEMCRQVTVHCEGLSGNRVTQERCGKRFVGNRNFLYITLEFGEMFETTPCSRK
jgi:hypothetical protein